MTIQLTNIASASDPALQIAVGDYLYVADGVRITTSAAGGDAVSGPATGNVTVDIYGDLFSPFAGYNNQGTGYTTLHVGASGSVDGGSWGALVSGSGGSIIVDGTI